MCVCVGEVALMGSDHSKEQAKAKPAVNEAAGRSAASPKATSAQVASPAPQEWRPPAAASERPSQPQSPRNGRTSPEINAAVSTTAAHHFEYPPEAMQLSPDQVSAIAFGFQRPPLGQGGFSTVYEGEVHHRGTGLVRPVAVKLLAIRNPQEHQCFLIELAVLRNPQLRHPNLLPLLGFCMERPALLFPRLKPLNRERLPRLPGSVRMRVTMDVARGLAHLHAAGFVHNDMKPDNVLLQFDDDRRIVRALVGDLGCAKSMQVPVQPFGTVLFMDPSLNPHGPPVHPKGADDVYSFALTIVCIFTNEFPQSTQDLLRMWGTIDRTFPLIAALARRMTLPNPCARPTCVQVLQELMAIDAGWQQVVAQQQQQQSHVTIPLQHPQVVMQSPNGSGAYAPHANGPQSPTARSPMPYAAPSQPASFSARQV